MRNYYLLTTGASKYRQTTGDDAYHDSDGQSMTETRMAWPR